MQHEQSIEKAWLKNAVKTKEEYTQLPVAE